tara:strand:- start:3648 stop:3878 length:231 start_codon:yes stop_codon:yes gene_type:complete
MKAYGDWVVLERTTKKLESGLMIDAGNVGLVVDSADKKIIGRRVLFSQKHEQHTYGDYFMVHKNAVMAIIQEKDDQ